MLTQRREPRSLLRVARTIADLEGSGKIAEYHIAEAVAYRGNTT